MFAKFVKDFHIPCIQRVWWSWPFQTILISFWRRALYRDFREYLYSNLNTWNSLKLKKFISKILRLICSVNFNKCPINFWWGLLFCNPFISQLLKISKCSYHFIVLLEGRKHIHIAVMRLFISSQLSGFFLIKKIKRTPRFFSV